MSGGLFGGLVKTVFGGSDEPSAPDYTPMANASRETAEIGAKLGREQLDENRRQYDLNMRAAQPIIAAQTAMMDSSRQQGDEYYNYLKDTFRPVERSIVNDAAKYDTQAYRDDMAGKAMADVSIASSNAQGQTGRRMAAMGINPNSGKFAAAERGMELENASMRAGAANGARANAEALGYARKMDAAGLGRNLPGASSGAYQVATGAGSAASGIQSANSAQYLDGINAGNSTIMGGRSLYQGGLGSILSSQTSAYGSTLGAETAQRGQNFDLLGSGSAAAMKMMSDKRLKKNIVKLLDDVRGFGWYAYEYVWGGPRQVGVMAQEVLGIIPGAVHSVNGYLAVDYSAIKEVMT